LGDHRSSNGCNVSGDAVCERCDQAGACSGYPWIEIGAGFPADHHVEPIDDLACLDKRWHARFGSSDG
jgi:hypothetical protein